MSESGLLTVGMLRGSLAPRGDAASRHACALLQAVDASQPAVLTVGVTADLRTIYQRRSQRPAPLPGVVELARSLASYPHAALKSTYVAVGGRFVLVWLALDESEVLGCVVGRDHRSDPDQP